MLVQSKTVCQENGFQILALPEIDFCRPSSFRIPLPSKYCYYVSLYNTIITAFTDINRADVSMMPELVSGWHVDEAIKVEEDRVVCIRFGKPDDQDTMQLDGVLAKIAQPVSGYAVIYRCDIDRVPDFNSMYELYDPVCVMFFFRNKHIMVDVGTGNNNKINWVLTNKQEWIDIIETVYRGASKGRGLVISPKDYSTQHKH